MNFTKKLTLAASAILLTSTLAMAQPVGTIVGTYGTANTDVTFTLAMEQNAVLTVYDNTASTVTEASLTNSAPLVAGLLAVKSNLAAWDIRLDTENGGKMRMNNYYGYGIEFIQKLSGNVLGDAILNVQICFADGYTTATPTAVAASLSTSCNSPATTTNTNVQGHIPLDGTPNQSVYLSNSLAGRANGFPMPSGGTNTVPDESYFVIYATFGSGSQLAGAGTYTEKLTFTLLSMY